MQALRTRHLSHTNLDHFKCDERQTELEVVVVVEGRGRKDSNKEAESADYCTVLESGEYGYPHPPYSIRTTTVYHPPLQQLLSHLESYMS